MKQSIDNLDFWQLKPFWCRPWSIVLTGLFILVISWTLLPILFACLASLAVIIWWFLFLKLVPDTFKRQLEID